MEALVEKLCNRFCGVTGMEFENCFDVSPCRICYSDLTIHCQL